MHDISRGFDVNSLQRKTTPTKYPRVGVLLGARHV
jgi:hypothetical protein